MCQGSPARGAHRGPRRDAVGRADHRHRPLHPLGGRGARAARRPRAARRRAPLGRAAAAGAQPHAPHARRAAARAAAERGLGLPRGGQRRPAAAARPGRAVRAHGARPHPPHLAGQRLPGLPLAVPTVARRGASGSPTTWCASALDPCAAPRPSPRAGPGAGLGGAQRRRPRPARAARRRVAGLAHGASGCPERWVLFAGALDARKNVALVLDALERLGPRAPALVLAGQRWYGSGPVERRIGLLRAARPRHPSARASSPSRCSGRSWPPRRCSSSPRATRASDCRRSRRWRSARRRW